MNKDLLKKIGIITGGIVISVYVLFLIVPFFLNGIANSCGNYISSIVKDTTGFNVKFEQIRFVTTPKLTVGAKIGDLSVKLPNNDEILSLNNAYAKVSLLPLIAKKIEIDTIGADNISASLKIKKDGKFLIEDFLPQTENSDVETVTAPVTGLPLGLKLSNHLPDIHVKNYKISFIDAPTSKEYYIQGEKFNITDFILNKKVKISTNGKIVLDDRVPFKYSIKVFNKIMPALDLNDLVFAPQDTSAQASPVEFYINPVDIFKTINKNMVTADLNADVTSYGSFEDINIDGFVNLDKISVAADGTPLPDGHVYINHKGKNIKINSAVFTAKDETTTINGTIVTGKKPHIDLTCKSNARFNNIFNLIDSIAKSVNYNELDTLSATGGIDADFNIKADTKKVQSSGYLKIPSASIKYALYNVLIDKITADIDFSNNMVNIKNAGFSVMNQPLKAYGTIKNDTTSDLHLTAEKLPIIGLITAAGQMALLKENKFNSGTLSLDAALKGKLSKPVPTVDLSVDRVNIKNIPTDTTLAILNSTVNLTADGKTYKGIVNAESVNIMNPMAKVAVPQAKVTLDDKNIAIDNTYLMLDNSRIDIAGKVTDYANKNIAMNITAKGNLLASDLRSMIPADIRGYVTGKGKLPLNVSITGNDKAQNIKASITATPSDYLNIIRVNELNGRNSIINTEIKIANDTLKLAQTGLYAGSLSNPLITVTGAVDKLSTKQLLNNIRITAPLALNFEIPGFSGSKTTAKADLTLNGSALAPIMKGYADISNVDIPSMKTSLKNIYVDINPKAITVNTPSIIIDNSTMKAKTVVSTNFNNGIIVNIVDFHSDMLDSDTLIKATANVPAATPGNGASTSSTPADLGVIVQKGKGTINKFKSGGIIATGLSSDFNVKNNTLYLKGLKGDAFDGKFNGDVSVNLISGNTNVDFHGTGMNAEKAIAGAAGLKNALSGTLGFNAKVSLNGYAPSEAAMMKSLKGNVDFDIQNGTFGNIGRLENLLYAQNITANAIMRTALAPVAAMPVIQNTAHFKSITGDLSFNNGWASLKSIKSGGPSMSAFIYGQYNLLNASANVTILGRLGAEVVKVLGPVGELSVDKLTAFIPKFGAATAKIINTMTTNPNGERTAEIPALTSGNTNYKDFKVSFNGGVESKSSVKSFKWLSVCDTSGIEGGSLKEQLQQGQNAVNQIRQQKKEEIQKSVENVRETAKQTSEDIKNQIQNTKDSINELKNLFKKPAAAPSATEAVPQ